MRHVEVRKWRHVVTLDRLFVLLPAHATDITLSLSPVSHEVQIILEIGMYLPELLPLIAFVMYGWYALYALDEPRMVREQHLIAVRSAHVTHHISGHINSF